jgi:AbrB family looped-hinge helix DNA binding protein
MYPVQLTNQGQISIPVAARKKIGFKPGDKLLVTPVGDKLIITRAVSLSDLNGIFSKYAKNYKPYDVGELWAEEYNK